MVLRKFTFFMTSIFVFASCNEAEFFQKKFLKGAGVNIDEEIEKTKNLCQLATEDNKLISYNTTVNFPAAIECDFNETGTTLDDINAAGNGPRIQKIITARDEKYDKVQLPEDGIICDLDFDFPTQAMQYDDEIFLLMNDYVIMSSTNYSTQSGSAYYTNGLAVDSHGLQKFKWSGGDNSLYGLFYGQDITPKYCLGLDSSMPNYDSLCEIPGTTLLGQIKLEIPKEKIIELSTVSGLLEGTQYNRSTLNFGFVTTGDNDNGDCEHSAFSFGVAIKYITPQ